MIPKFGKQTNPQFWKWQVSQTLFDDENEYPLYLDPKKVGEMPDNSLMWARLATAGKSVFVG